MNNRYIHSSNVQPTDDSYAVSKNTGVVYKNPTPGNDYGREQERAFQEEYDKSKK